LETALDEESRRHKETQNALRKKDRRIKEVQMQVDEEHKNFVMAQDTADRLLEKLNIQKRQLGEAVCSDFWNCRNIHILGINHNAKLATCPPLPTVS
jgi:hypothetical protein